MGGNLELLTEDECRYLLTREQVGRVAVALGALPVVFPVNYITAGDELLFFTAEGTKLRAATANQVVSFEVDHFDPIAETGWSVLAVGTARERTDAAVVVGARTAGLRPWAAGDHPHLISVTAEVVSGRRIAGVATDVRDSQTAIWTVGPHSPIASLAHRPIRVDRRSSIRAVAEAMQVARVSIVLVGWDEGAVSRSDVAGALRNGVSPDADITAIASMGLVDADEGATVVDAAAAMLRHELRHLAVRDHRGHITGVVTLHDLVRVLLDAMDPAVWVILRRTLSGGSRV
jgi:CBS domain-containing protein